MQRQIIGFFKDPEGDWTARLDCGHNQHVRHKPPLVERPWVLTAAGRQQQLGQPLNCLRCDQLEWPEGLEPYKRTAVFSAETLPTGLRKQHNTRAGVWARIEVLSGQLHYRVEPPVNRHYLLSPEQPGVVAPEILHHVEPVVADRQAGSDTNTNTNANTELRFFVEFYRLASASAPEY